MYIDTVGSIEISFIDLNSVNRPRSLADGWSSGKQRLIKITDDHCLHTILKATGGEKDGVCPDHHPQFRQDALEKNDGGGMNPRAPQTGLRSVSSSRQREKN